MKDLKEKLEDIAKDMNLEEVEARQIKEMNKNPINYLKSMKQVCDICKLIKDPIAVMFGFISELKFFKDNYKKDQEHPKDLIVTYDDLVDEVIKDIREELHINEADYFGRNKE